MGLNQIRAIQDGINSVLAENRIHKNQVVQTVETTVTDSEGNEFLVKTTRLPDEPVAEFKARHLEAVNAFKE